ncbi:MAG: DUF1844 domain-containing protein [Myxococcales bacterium]|nr:DUF1844 domain-containing protein [Myxococcales bacterium]MCB9578190.1 DUF1844 domain-containing protein [Polyangiaceae bacterium]
MSDAGGPDSGQQRAAEEAFQDASADARGGELPEVDFTTFVLSLTHNVRVHLGDAPSPGETTTSQSLPLARQTIDLLALLQEKTRGNLSGDEERILESALFDVRMRFVEVAKSK